VLDNWHCSQCQLCCDAASPAPAPTPSPSPTPAVNPVCEGDNYEVLSSKYRNVDFKSSSGYQSYHGPGVSKEAVEEGHCRTRNGQVLVNTNQVVNDADDPDGSAYHDPGKSPGCCDQHYGWWNTQPWIGWCEWKGSNWYRFMGEAGHKIAEAGDPIGDSDMHTATCNTVHSYGMLGGHPRTYKQEVTRQLYSAWPNNGGGGYTTQSWARIKVQRCPGDFFIYHLNDVPICYLGYCGSSNPPSFE